MSRGYRDCMFRSEWIKDAKSKRWVASDRRDWCLKSQKRKCNQSCLGVWLTRVTGTFVSLTPSHRHSFSATDSDRDFTMTAVRIIRIAIYFATSGSQCTRYGLCLIAKLAMSCESIWSLGPGSLLFGNVALGNFNFWTCDFFHDDRMELGSQCLFWNVT